MILGRVEEQRVPSRLERNVCANLKRGRRVRGRDVDDFDVGERVTRAARARASDATVVEDDLRAGRRRVLPLA